MVMHSHKCQGDGTPWPLLWTVCDRTLDCFDMHRETLRMYGDRRAPRGCFKCFEQQHRLMKQRSHVLVFLEPPRKDLPSLSVHAVQIVPKLPLIPMPSSHP